MTFTKSTATALIAVFLLAVAAVGFADKTEELVRKAPTAQEHEPMSESGQSQGAQTSPMNHEM